MLVLDIEVVYACQDTHQCITLKVQSPCTIEKAIQQSGILNLFPEINLANQNRVGIYNQIKSLNDLVEQGDRIEIYKPLHRSAMAARHERLKQLKQQKIKQRTLAKDPG
ncbi:MAG: RnfH family protein [Proteobacteria bacterium]|nr:RnfH family protein [Pseudomonadota bacterium]